MQAGIGEISVYIGDRLKAVNNTERERLTAMVGDLQNAIADLQQQIEAAEEELDACRFWHRVTGRQREIEARLDLLRSRLTAPTKTLPEIGRDLSLLKHDPGQYGVGFSQSARAAEERVERLKVEQSWISRRLAQIDLLIAS